MTWMKYLMLFPLLTLVCAASAAEQRVPPQFHCMDVRQIGKTEALDARTLVLHQKDEKRYRIQLQHACPAPDNSLGVLGAADGWLCGNDGESLRLGDQQCAVTQVQPLDNAAYASLLRDRESTGIQTLSTVNAQARTARGFRGTADYCVATNNIRSWNEDASGVVVEVNPRRAAGKRFYRIELVNACPGLSGSPNLALVSGVGVGMVCGHPGDRIQLSRPDRRLVGSAMFDTSARSDGTGDAAEQARQGPMQRMDCQIRSVYPIEGRH